MATLVSKDEETLEYIKEKKQQEQKYEELKLKMLENKQEEITQQKPITNKNQRSCSSNINYTDVSDNDDLQNQILSGLADAGRSPRLGKRTCSQRKRDKKKLEDQLLTDA